MFLRSHKRELLTYVEVLVLVDSLEVLEHPPPTMASGGPPFGEPNCKGTSPTTNHLMSNVVHYMRSCIHSPEL